MSINLNDFTLDRVVKDLSKKYHSDKKNDKKDIKIKGDMDKKKKKDKEKVTIAGVEMEKGQLKKIAKQSSREKEFKDVKVPKTRKSSSCMNVELGG